VAVAYTAAVIVGVPYLAPGGWLAMAAIGILPAGLAIGAWRLCPPSYQLWADYHGSTVLLFASNDERIFGHVCRALIRAREHRPPEPPYQDAVA
jgi:hypothetical protein